MSDHQQTVQKITGSILSWWLGELRELLPRAFRYALEARRASFVLIVNGSHFVLLKQAKHGDRSELGRLGKASIDQLTSSKIEFPDALSALTEHRYRNWPLIVELDQHLGMRKTLDLPLVDNEDLGQILHFELDRLTPFRAEEVCLAWRVEHTNASAKHMRVMLEIAPRTIIDQVRNLASLFERQVNRIELSGGPPGHQPLDLQIGRREIKTPSGLMKIVHRLLAPILLMVAIFIPIRYQYDAINNLESQIEATKEQAEEALKLQDQLTLLTRETSFLVDAKRRNPAMTELLAELTRILPRHSHILQLNVDAPLIELLGLAGKASDVITALDRSPLLQAPKFDAAVTYEPGSGKERFHILVELSARGP